jgi:hypothetical protein
VAALFVWQRNNHATTTKSDEPAAVQSSAVQSSAVSEHDWAKHSLDRAHEVRDQVVRIRQENEQP